MKGKEDRFCAQSISKHTDEMVTNLFPPASESFLEISILYQTSSIQVVIEILTNYRFEHPVLVWSAVLSSHTGSSGTFGH